MLLKYNSKEKWSIIREKGLVSFIVKKTLPIYGISMFIIQLFIVGFVDSNLSFYFIYKKTFLTKVVILALISVFYGIIMGYTIWKENEKRY